MPPVVEVSADEHPAPVAAPLGDPQLALFAPAPIISRQQASQAPCRWLPPIRPAAGGLCPGAGGKPVQPVMAVKPHAPPVAHAANRPGYMLDDTQIASIKQRLRLTPDQERMWPAVEVALRNIAFARARDATPTRCTAGRHRSQQHRSAGSQIRGHPAAHELQRPAEGRGPQPHPRHGRGSAGDAILI